MTDVSIDLWSKQYDFLVSKKKSALLQCGVGYGKTFVGAVFVVSCLQVYRNCNYMIVSRDIPQFKKAVLPEMLKALKLFDYKEGPDYSFNRSENTFHFKTENVTIYCVGAVNYDSSFRGPNIAIMLSDETEYYKKEAWNAMLGRLRVYPELLRCMSTPNGFNFVSDYFIENKKDSKEVLIAPSWENKTLNDEYIEMLRETYSPKLFAQEVEAKRLLVKVGQVYDEFSRDKHVKKCRHLLTKQDQLYFFTDYNISNYCGTYMFFRDGIVYAIGEEHLKFQGTRQMAQVIIGKYPSRNVIVVGDSTGNNKRDVAIDQTNYQQFEQAGLLTRHHPNPPVESRIISANSSLYHSRIVIDPECKNLIRDCELVSWKEDGSNIDKTDITLTHASDGASYGWWFFLPLRRRSNQYATNQRR